MTLVTASPLMVSADTPDTGTDTPSATSTSNSGTSSNSVSFSAPDDSMTPPDVVNPTDPNTPPSLIPSKPGARVIDLATAVDFGSHMLDGSTTTFEGKVTTGTTGDKGTPLLAWHDLDGTAPAVGYKITAAVTTPFGMDGATVTYGSGTLANTSGGNTTDTTGITNSDVTLGEDGEAQTVVNATGALDGHFADEFGSVALSVPVASQTVGAHSATVTWTMTDAI